MLKKQFILNLRCLAYKASKIKTNLMMKKERENMDIITKMVVFIILISENSEQ